jgi:hypothetical protein
MFHKKIRLWYNNGYVVVFALSQKLTYLLTYGAEPFLRSCQLCSHSGTSQHSFPNTLYANAQLQITDMKTPCRPLHKNVLQVHIFKRFTHKICMKDAWRGPHICPSLCASAGMYYMYAVIKRFTWVVAVGSSTRDGSSNQNSVDFFKTKLICKQFVNGIKYISIIFPSIRLIFWPCAMWYHTVLGFIKILS